MSLQRTDAWFQKRLGKVTASRVSDVCAKIKSGAPSASRATYMGELIAERLTGVPTEKYINGAMEWGTETEEQARAAYSFHRDLEVTECDFILHPKISMAGASPDGTIGQDGLLEIKCPQTAGHIDTLLGQAIPNKYLLQMQMQLACTGRQWVDFVSFDPRLPENMSLFVQRVPRDDALIKDLEKHVVEFLAELDAKLAKLAERYEIKRAA